MKEQKHYFLEKKNYSLSQSHSGEETFQKYHEQQLVWGFDETELWNLDKTLLLLLYERLAAFYNIISTKDRLELNTIQYDVQILPDDDKVSLTLEQCIQFMLGTIEKIMIAWDELNLVQAFDLSKLVWSCWKEVSCELWY